MVRRYAVIAGVLTILIGLGGLLFGEQVLLGSVNIYSGYLAEPIIHLVLGGLLTYVGLAPRVRRVARRAVGGYGVVALLAIAPSFLPLPPVLLRAAPPEWLTAHNLFHLAVGLLSIAVAWFAPRDMQATS